MKIKIKKEFKPLYTSKKRYIYLHGGRAGAKSFSVADFIVRLSFEVGQKILYTRYTLTAADKSVIPEFIEKLGILGVEDLFYVTKDKIINKVTDVEIIFSGIKTSSGNQTARLKSIPNITTWVYEEFEEHPDSESFEDVDFSIRKKGIQNRIILLSNALHKKSWQYKRFFEEETDITKIYVNYLTNKDNLSDSFLDKAEATRLNNPKKYDKIFLGLHYEDFEGALWKWELIDDNRIKEAPKTMDRIVVSVDPAVTSNENSDETGIVVCARLGNHGYVLSDATGKYSPNQWASTSISEYKQFKADRIIGEVNNGGDMIEATIRNQDKFVSYKSVRATRGKAIRAEPIVSLYEAGRIHHVGYFPKLEQELTSWKQGDDSPNRLDAIVWGFTELFGQEERFTENLKMDMVNI